MNDWDKKNLHFIINSMDAAFDDWMRQASQDDINYALELIANYRQELLDMEDSLFGDVTDFTEANQIINRVKEKL
jgi:hypothetical protein